MGLGSELSVKSELELAQKEDGFGNEHLSYSQRLSRQMKANSDQVKSRIFGLGGLIGAMIYVGFAMLDMGTIGLFISLAFLVLWYVWKVSRVFKHEEIKSNDIARTRSV